MSSADLVHREWDGLLLTKKGLDNWRKYLEEYGITEERFLQKLGELSVDAHRLPPTARETRTSHRNCRADGGGGSPPAMATADARRNARRTDRRPTARRTRERSRAWAARHGPDAHWR